MTHAHGGRTSEAARRRGETRPPSLVFQEVGYT